MKKDLPKILEVVLDIQELDMQMIQLMRLKKERQTELNNFNSIRRTLGKKIEGKEEEILKLKTAIRLTEGEIEEVNEKIKKYEGQQHTIRKVEEFNALSQEMSHAERERVAKEQRSSDLHDQLAAEEDALKSLSEKLEATTENSKILEKEISESIEKINTEGRSIQGNRNKLATKADHEVLSIYERLLRNKKDRVVVPIENRSCSGCHIMLTAQDENLVRKGERLVFCEHCSRIHYWPESAPVEGEESSPKRRRKRAVSA